MNVYFSISWSLKNYSKDLVIKISQLSNRYTFILYSNCISTSTLKSLNLSKYFLWTLTHTTTTSREILNKGHPIPYVIHEYGPHGLYMLKYTIFKDFGCLHSPHITLSRNVRRVPFEYPYIYLNKKEFFCKARV